MTTEAQKAAQRLGNLDNLNPDLKEQLLQMAANVPEPDNKHVLPNGMTVWYHHVPDAPHMSVKLSVNPETVFASEDEKTQYAALGMLLAQLLNRPIEGAKTLTSTLEERGYNFFIHAGAAQLDLESPYVQNEKLADVLSAYDEKLSTPDALERMEFYKTRLMKFSPHFERVLEGVSADDFEAYLKYTLNPQFMTLTVAGSVPSEQAWKTFENAALAKREPTGALKPMLSIKPLSVQRMPVFVWEKQGR